MEKPSENQKETDNPKADTGRNANSAYSGSGSWQPGSGAGEAGKLSDTTIEAEDGKQTENLPVNPSEQPFNSKSAPEHGTDPSKLNDL